MMKEIEDCCSCGGQGFLRADRHGPQRLCPDCDGRGYVYVDDEGFTTTESHEQINEL